MSLVELSALVFHQSAVARFQAKEIPGDTVCGNINLIFRLLILFTPAHANLMLIAITTQGDNLAAFTIRARGVTLTEVR